MRNSAWPASQVRPVPIAVRRREGLRPIYPQDAQSAVEMLIIQRSQIASFFCFATLAGCPQRPYISSCAERGAGVGRSSTGRSYETARKGRSGKSTGVVDETATGSANFFGPPQVESASPAAPRISPLHYDRRDAPASSSEHRPGRHRRPLGRRPRGVHLLRPDRGRSKRRDGDRARARLVRGDLAVRAVTRRSGSRPAPPAPVETARLRRPTAGMARSEREQQLPRQLAADLGLEPLLCGNGLWIEAFEVRCEKPHPPLRRGLGEHCHPVLYIGDLPL